MSAEVVSVSFTVGDHQDCQRCAREMSDLKMAGYAPALVFQDGANVCIFLFKSISSPLAIPSLQLYRRED